MQTLTLSPKAQAFEAAQPGLLAFLLKAGDWSTFAADLALRIINGKPLSEKQLAAALSMQAKAAAKAKAPARTIAVDLSGVQALFAKVLGAGNKRATFRGEGLKLAPALRGPNKGAIYVAALEDGTYLGKVVAGTFQPVAAGSTPAIFAGLQMIALDPLAAAIRHGKATGACACCGRTLKDPVSIELGIGPVCKAAWGL